MEGYHAAVAMTKSDDSADDLTSLTNAVYVGGAGDVIAIMNGAEITFKAVPVGTILPIRTKRIKSTGTTASLFVGLFGEC